MASRIKRLTSGKRRRFSESGFDLDLTYIKPNIIAMGFPSERLEGLYRNHIDKVVRFFDAQHRDHYKVYNLCSERSYDPAKFHQRVATYPFEIKMPPPFELIKLLCEDLDEWLKADDRNVACIHCHDGLRRTGVMICSYLLHDRFFGSTKDALQFFAEARTQNEEGVTVPSQERYVQYYEYLLKNNLTYNPKTVWLKSIRFIGTPKMQGGTCAPYFTVHVQKLKMYTSKLYENIKRTDSTANLMLPQELPLCGDVRIDFYHQSTIGKERMFRFWFNTFFIDMHLLQQENSSWLTHSTSTVPRQDADVNITTGVPALDKNSSETSPLTYRKIETQSKQFTKALKKAGKQAGVDITTGVTALYPKPHNVTSKGSEKQNPILTTSKLVSEPLDMGLTIINFPRSELDRAYKDKNMKHYPDNFQVHLCLSTLGHPSISGDLSGDCYFDDNDTDLSDTDDEDLWVVISAKPNYISSSYKRI